jgi:hypothetical protein
MLHAISVPDWAPNSIYVQESVLVSLTPIKIESCGQPLRRYPGGEYDLFCPESDIRCRSRTESGDSRSICGKSLKRRATDRRQEGSIVASSISRTGNPSRTGYTLRQAVHFRASGSLFNSRSFLHAGQTIRSRRSWEIMMQDCTTARSFFTTESQRHRGRHGETILDHVI